MRPSFDIQRELETIDLMPALSRIYRLEAIVSELLKDRAGLGIELKKIEIEAFGDTTDGPASKPLASRVMAIQKILQEAGDIELQAILEGGEQK